MKNKLIYISLGLFLVFSCKKERQPSPQYYGEPILASKEHFPNQELFDFTTSPAISPNGRYLIYIVPSTMSQERQGIWLIDLQTSEKRFLKKDATFSFPSWAPDSQHFCYTFNGNLMISDLSGNNAEQLTQNRRCFRPDWHQTKNKIAFDDALRNIFSIDAATKEMINSVVNKDIGGAAKWLGSTDSVIVLMDNAYKIANIRTGQVLSDIKANFLTGVPTITYPAVSRDGKQIAFVTEKGIYIINTDGTHLQQVLYNEVRRKPGTPYKHGDKEVNDLSWHPDGKHLVYQVIEFTNSSIGFGTVIFGEGYSVLYKLNIEKALQINKP